MMIMTSGECQICGRWNSELVRNENWAEPACAGCHAEREAEMCEDESIAPEGTVLTIVREPVVEDDDAPDIDWDAHMFDMAIRQ